MENQNRIIFLDYLRVLACLLVMLAHACELYYFGADGGLYLASKADALWVTLIDSACRVAVPLFVIASSYLLFPLHQSTGEFFRRRFPRVLIPFAIWSGIYIWRFEGRIIDSLFNFPMATGGHLWFVPMLLGVYLLMPLLSPWAERVTKKGLLGWLGLWLFTTTFPFLRKLCGYLCGAPSFGVTPYLYGECPWNEFGMFQYVSGFFGYLLLGLYCKRFLSELSWKKTLAIAIPIWAVGYAIAWSFFYFRLQNYGVYPITAPYAQVVNLETSWLFCSTGVALTTIGYLLILHKINLNNWLYKHLVRPLSIASYGTYLVHILVLVFLGEKLRGTLPTPLALVGIAVGTFSISSCLSLALRKIPFIGKWIVG